MKGILRIKKKTRKTATTSHIKLSLIMKTNRLAALQRKHMLSDELIHCDETVRNVVHARLSPVQQPTYHGRLDQAPRH